MSRFQTLYHETIVPELIKKFGYKTVMQVPRITKITLNMGVGEAVNDKKLVDNAVGDLTKIAGQKPVVTKTRKAIANFKIRENMPIGCMVTLRGERMYDFLDRLITIAFPRVRDFRGVSGRSFDGRIYVRVHYPENKFLLMMHANSYQYQRNPLHHFRYYQMDRYKVFRLEKADTLPRLHRFVTHNAELHLLHIL